MFTDVLRISLPSVSATSTSISEREFRLVYLFDVSEPVKLEAAGHHSGDLSQQPKA